MSAQLPPYEDPDLLSRALERTPQCPPLEQVAAAGLGGLAAERREEILAHAGRCPACGAEVALARCFETGHAADAAAVDHVVSRLRAEVDRGARVLEFPAAGPAAPSPRGAAWARWAAAALVVVGVGLAVQAVRESRLPELGAPGTGGVVRGGEIALVAPLDEVVGAPVELSWEPVPEAVRYEVEILDVAGEPIARLETSRSRVALGPAHRRLLLERARYGWRVTAWSDGGAELARSATAEFEVRPAG